MAGEQNIEALLDRLESMGFYAVEVIPTRNTRERLAEIVSAARRRWWPVFNGTEHNTPESRPLLDPFALDPEFEPWFCSEHGAAAGPPAACRQQGRRGLWIREGTPTISDAKDRFEHFSQAGQQ